MLVAKQARLACDAQWRARFQSAWKNVRSKVNPADIFTYALRRLNLSIAIASCGTKELLIVKSEWLHHKW
jgi:hypothetical protein